MRIARLPAIPALLALFLFTVPSFVSAEEGPPEGSVPPAETTQVPMPVPAPVPVSDVGRYHLLEAQYIASSASGEQTAERQLFKLDTVTGNVWVGRQVQFVDRKSGRLVQQRYWEPFEQYLTTPQAR